MIEGFIEVYKTYDPIEAKLIAAKLQDREIEFDTFGDFDLTLTMDTFNTPISRMALEQPIIFCVKEEDKENVLKIIREDKSEMMKDDLEY
ncbi:MAG TPA: hypothetical protein PK447_00355 [Ignavibacteria bacterium]|jgi:hypothetical protein|nr:hypothetical protein [Ignavibacteria bacterium]